MSNFTKNVNEFITNKKIKQSYLALKTGMNTNKISRILNQTQNATEKDMEEISNALGYPIDFFLSPNFKVEDSETDYQQVAFYSGDVKSINYEVVKNCISLLENIHSILGREQGLLYHMNEELYADK